MGNVVRPVFPCYQGGGTQIRPIVSSVPPFITFHLRLCFQLFQVDGRLSVFQLCLQSDFLRSSSFRVDLCRRSFINGDCFLIIFPVLIQPVFTEGSEAGVEILRDEFFQVPVVRSYTQGVMSVAAWEKMANGFKYPFCFFFPDGVFGHSGRKIESDMLMSVVTLNVPDTYV